jgi:competence protein ComEA
VARAVRRVPSEEDVVSFETPSGEPPRAEPARPRASGDPLAALVTRLRAWAGWVGTGRIVAGALFVVAVFAGGWWLLRTPPPPTEAGLPFAASSTGPPGADSRPPGSVAPSTVAQPAAIVVHVAGAVARPGVYELPAGSRVGAAIETAGGPSRRADPGALNLAAPLADGERVYVPKIGETVPLGAAADAPEGSAAPAGPIDVNRATAEQLDTLPGIGPTTAAAIVDHREQNGPFGSVDDLEAVRGIGPAKLDAIRDLVAV